MQTSGYADADVYAVADASYAAAATATADADGIRTKNNMSRPHGGGHNYGKNDIKHFYLK